MTLPTEPVGSIPRPRELIEGMAAFGTGRIGREALDALFDGAVRDTLRRFEETNLGSTDDCGFSPFGDDTSTSRETAFAKIKARVEGNAMASRELRV
jgi:methionine synthase II (cobalamin-independent)